MPQMLNRHGSFVQALQFPGDPGKIDQTFSFADTDRNHGMKIESPGMIRFLLKQIDDNAFLLRIYDPIFSDTCLIGIS